MRYPKLPRELDLRWKLSEEQIKALQEEYWKKKDGFASKNEIAKARKLGLPLPESKTAWMNKKAGELGVSYHTIYYWCESDYRERKRNGLQGCSEGN